MMVCSIRSRRVALSLTATAILMGVGLESTDAAARSLAVVRHVRGDVNGDGIADITFMGGAIPGTDNGSGGLQAWNTIPVAFSDPSYATFSYAAGGNGTYFPFSNNWVTALPALAAGDVSAPAMSVMGDFNGDGCSDVAVIGVATAQAGGIQVGISNCIGGFTYAALPVSSNFAMVAGEIGTFAFTGDFNGDGKSDIALYSNLGDMVYTALSVVGGTPTAPNGGFYAPYPVSGSQISVPGGATGNGKAMFVTGDFNGDRKDDIAIVGDSTSYIYIGFSNGDGTYNPLTISSSLGMLAGFGGSTALSGDFDGDGYADIALVGGSDTQGTWGTVPVLFGPLTSSSAVTTEIALPTFPVYAALAEVQAVSGDFNGDGKTDIALLNLSYANGYPYPAYMPIAFSTGSGSTRGTFSMNYEYAPTVMTVSTQGADSLDPVFALSASPSAGDLPVYYVKKNSAGVCAKCMN